MSNKEENEVIYNNALMENCQIWIEQSVTDVLFHISSVKHRYALHFLQKRKLYYM